MEVIELECLIIGAGVAGLAVARELSNYIDEIAVIEKNQSFGEETSSRNSEVIHAGIYYNKGSLKHNLIKEGREMLYDYLQNRNLPFLKSGKYIVSTTSNESERLNFIFNNAKNCGVDNIYYDTQTFKKKYPYITADQAIFSPSSGIIDSHQFMQSLKNEFEMNGGHIIFNNNVIDVTINDDFIDTLVVDQVTKKKFLIKSHIAINCCGLGSVEIHKLAFPHDTKITSRYVKGDYYTYGGNEKIDNLIYPIPEKDGLGVHITLDLNSQLKLGPSAYEVCNVDYSMNERHKINIVKSVQKYWKDIDPSKINASYSGIRPKLLGEDDFIIKNEKIQKNKFISVMGYDSPGLSSSLGLAKYINKILSS